MVHANYRKKRNDLKSLLSRTNYKTLDDEKPRPSETETKIESSSNCLKNRNDSDLRLLPTKEEDITLKNEQKIINRNFISDSNIEKKKKEELKDEINSVKDKYSTPVINSNEEFPEKTNEIKKTVRDLVVSISSKKYNGEGIELSHSKKELHKEIAVTLTQNPELLKEIENVNEETKIKSSKLNLYISENNVRVSGTNIVNKSINDKCYDKLYDEVANGLIRVKEQAEEKINQLKREETIPANFEKESNVVDIKQNNLQKTARKAVQKSSEFSLNVEDEKALQDNKKSNDFEETIGGINITLIDKIKNSVANYSENKNKKSKIEKILHSKIQKFQNEKKSKDTLELKNKRKLSENSDKITKIKNPEIRQRNTLQEDNFYYLSELSYSLAVGAEVIEEAAKLGIEYIYEYDESGKEEIIKINEKDKNERIKKNVFFNHFHHCLQSIAYISTVEELSEDEFLHKKVYLPPKKNKHLKTLILDLDETLVHCTENLKKPFNFKTPIRFTGGETIDFGVSIRPNAINFLKLLSKFFEIVIFTASHSCYANSILNLLDPNHEYITFRLFRESCIEIEDGIFVKDLRIFGNRNLDELLIVDNACYSYAFQLTNGIPIVPYFFGKNDTQLIELSGILISLINKSKELPSVINQYESMNPVCEFEENFNENRDDGVGEDLDYYRFMDDVEKISGKYFKIFSQYFSETEDSLREKINWYFKGDVYKVFLENYGEKAPPLIAKYIINHTLGVEKN